MKRTAKLLSLALALLLALMPLTAWAEESEAAPIDAAPAETEVDLASEFEDAPEVEVETDPEGMPALGPAIEVDMSIDMAKSMSISCWVGSKLTVDDENGDSGIAYKSSNTKVASVNDVGVADLKKTGTVKITMTLAGGEKRVLTIKVVKPDVVLAGMVNNAVPGRTYLTNDQTCTVTIGETVGVMAQTQSEIATWVSSDESIVGLTTMSYGNTLDLKKPGTVTLTASVPGSKPFKFKVKVLSANTPKSITELSVSDHATYEEYTANIGKTIEVPQNQKLDVVAKLLPTAAETTFKWKSSNSKVLKVVSQYDENNECSVMPLKAGTATLTCTTDNGLTAKVKIKVVAQKVVSMGFYSYQQGGDVAYFAKGKTIKVTVGEQLQFGQFLNFGKETGTVKWKSSNSKVLRIDKEHYNHPICRIDATALKAGTATLTCTSSKLGKFSVKVKVAANKKDKLSVKPTKSDMKSADFDLWLKSLEYKGDGSLVAEFYLLNGVNTMTYIDGLEITLTGYDTDSHVALEAYADFGSIKLGKSKKYASKIVKVTFQPSDISKLTNPLIPNYVYINASVTASPRYITDVGA